jgi:hypothetical protein
VHAWHGDCDAAATAAALKLLDEVIGSWFGRGAPKKKNIRPKEFG